jgi:predicted RNA methylase
VKIGDDVLAVLSAAEIDGSLVRITGGQLERKLYQRVDAVLVELGGKWNRRSRAHVFAGDPSDRLDAVINAGEITTARDLGFFATPAWLAKRVIERAEVRPGMRALEPSAGEGALALEARAAGATVLCVEIDERRAAALDALEFTTVTGDFLDCDPERYGPFDRVVMNPPFARQADVAHVTRAFGMLKPGGRLVAIMSAGTSFRQDRKATEFRELVESHGSLEPLPEGAFAESGTGVRTVLVTLDSGRGVLHA